MEPNPPPSGPPPSVPGAAVNPLPNQDKVIEPSAVVAGLGSQSLIRNPSAYQQEKMVAPMPSTTAMNPSVSDTSLSRPADSKSIVFPKVSSATVSDQLMKNERGAIASPVVTALKPIPGATSASTAKNSSNIPLIIDNNNAAIPSSSIASSSKGASTTEENASGMGKYEHVDAAVTMAATNMHPTALSHPTLASTHPTTLPPSSSEIGLMNSKSSTFINSKSLSSFNQLARSHDTPGQSFFVPTATLGGGGADDDKRIMEKTREESKTEHLKAISPTDGRDDSFEKQTQLRKEEYVTMLEMEDTLPLTNVNASVGNDVPLSVKGVVNTSTKTMTQLHQRLGAIKDACATTMPDCGLSSMDVETSNLEPATSTPTFFKESTAIPGQEMNPTPFTGSDSTSHMEISSDSRPSALFGSYPVVGNGQSSARTNDAQLVAASATMASTASSNMLPDRNDIHEQQDAPSSTSSSHIVVVQSDNNNSTAMAGTTSFGTRAAVSTASSAPAISSPDPAPFAQPPPNSIINAPVNNASTTPASSSTMNNNVLHPTGRELKVEDALLYLDQVKLEFGDRPRIYNEFLEIMKNFKAQEVDTIGVINRVRTLFHGYNNLILGFNTFLPEGYKIEMRDLEPVFVGPGLSGTSHTPGYKPPPGPGGGGGRGMPPGRSGPPQQHPGGGRGMSHPPPTFGRGNIAGRGVPPPGRGMMGRGPPAGPSGRGMTGRGGPPPQIGGHGRGMPLPGGRGGVPLTGGRGGIPQSSQGRMQPMPLQPQHIQAHNVQQKQAQIQLQPTQQHEHQSMGMDTSQNRNATRTIEFDHAIMYVTNIKKRFANQPRIYHTFLEILHTYQKEQRGIKEVLEQVSSLFADHPDLLREFTFFLPDAVQEQAKERLSRAAAEAEAKQRAAAVEAAAAKHHQAQAHHVSALDNGKLKSAPTGWRATANIGNGPIPKVGKIGQNASMEPLLPSGTQKFIDMTQPGGAGLESARRPSAPGVTATKNTQQEVFVYNSGVERQFFDLVKAALTSFSRDGQAYAEFIKTLDMYAQEILSRNDMLGYVERLLGKHKDLFDEFKRIINAVGSPDAPTHDDSWHSVPLSEIDFSRCRRCSPSYRALPRDYPNPPCSERSEEESKVLNDVWVSLPMGSEENSTFRHMRKNQYEETLFQCEDMRFEIDMCIDSNAATLQRLIKISDELRFLAENELLLTKRSAMSKSSAPDGAGFGGKIYQYTLDGRVLGVIHKLAIKRIYGDDGNEMLELCFKNPAVALPIVVNRLRQKDDEWRSARDMLNKKWKDVAEHNYYKSLDHRSITWRATDKRATSTRSLVAEIKDRATHNGCEGEAACSARIEKAKEEHGAFYEVTMGCALSRTMDLAGLPLPSRKIFTPHMSFMYDNTSWTQHDAYRLISFALERGSVNPGDKERCHRLWCDFIGPWFGLSLSWMQSPAALFTCSSELLEEDNDAESSSTENEDMENGSDDKVMSCKVCEVNANNDNITASIGKDVEQEMNKPNTIPSMSNGYFSKLNHVPFPPETFVSTTFGEGKIIQYIEREGVYEVSIPPESDDASTAYLRFDAIYGTIFPVEPSLLTEQLRENDLEEPERADDQLIIGTQCLYLFFRLHQILIKRLTLAKKLAFDVSNDLALGKHVEKLTSDGDTAEGEKRYGAFLDLVYSLIDAGSADASEGGRYEDRVMHLLGNNAYELTTMDKLISHVLKHLQNMANDDVLQNMIEIYRRHRLAGAFKPSAFREEASLMSDGENMFAFQICAVPRTDQKICHCEFLGCIAEDVEDEDNVALGITDNKRSINDSDMDDADVCANDAKRIKRNVS